MASQAVYGILFSEDKKKVLLVKRRDIPVWVLPGGGLDPGETPEEGVIREVEEETGLQITIIRQIAEYLPVNRLTQKTYFFECKSIGGRMQSNSESKEVSFFDLTNLPKRLAPPFKEWIRDACLGKQSILIKPTEGVTYRILIKLLLMHPLLVVRYFLTKVGIRFNARD